MKARATIAAIATALAVSACGGGGSSGGAQSPSPVPSGPASASSPTGSASAASSPGGPASAASSPSGVQLSSDFGVDNDGNGVPDRLDAYVAGIQGSPATKAAATAYFRLISRLAAKVVAGTALTEPERVSVFVAAQCYGLSAHAEGVVEAGLDSEFMKDRNSFNAMYALMGALNGTFAKTSLDKVAMCAA